jgi:hypothetical protein
MFGLSPKDAWLLALLVISCAAYLAAAVWWHQLEDGRPIVLYSIGFSLAFALLALATGMALLH